MPRLLTTVSIIDNKLVIQDERPQTRDDKINALLILTTLKQYEIMNKISFGILLDQHTDKYCKFSISYNLIIAKKILLEKFHSNPGVDALRDIETMCSAFAHLYQSSLQSVLTKPSLTLATIAKIPSFDFNRLWYAYLDYEGCLHVPILDSDKYFLCLFTNFFKQTIDLINVRRLNPIYQVTEDSINFEVLLIFQSPPTRLELLDELHFIINPQKYYLSQKLLETLMILENTIRYRSRARDFRVLDQETLTANSIGQVAFSREEPHSNYDLKALLNPSQFKTEVYMFIPKLYQDQLANNTAVILNRVILNSNLQNEISVSSNESKKMIFLTFHNPNMWKKHLITLRKFYQMDENRNKLDPFNILLIQFDQIIKSSISISLDKKRYKAELVALALRKKIAHFLLHYYSELSLAVDKEQNKIILLFNPDTADLLFPKLYNLLIKDPKPSSNRRDYLERSNTPITYRFFSYNGKFNSFDQEKEEEEHSYNTALNGFTRQPFSS